jgi:hypothetical protein
LAGSPDLSACVFLFMGLFDEEVFQTRSADLHILKLTIYGEKIALSPVMSVECDGLWTGFISASFVMDDIWRVFLGVCRKTVKGHN